MNIHITIDAETAEAAIAEMQKLVGAGAHEVKTMNEWKAVDAAAAEKSDAVAEEKPKAKPRSRKKKVEEPDSKADEKKDDIPTAEPVDDEKEVTLEAVRTKMVELMKSDPDNGATVVKETLATFDAAKAGDLSAEQRAQFVAAIDKAMT